MIDYLPAPADVIALRASGKLQHQELQDLVDRFTQALADRPLTHVFVEVTQFDGVELDGMTDHLARTTPLLRELRKFGRIAIVADQQWIRQLSRLESALLPNVSYEVYEPQDRERAWRWATGEVSAPRE